MLLITINMNELASEADVHKIIRSELNVPEYYGDNLDALYDILMGGLGDPVCIGFTSAAEGSPLYDYSKKMTRMLEDGAETINEFGDAVYYVFASSDNPEEWGMRSW